MSVAPAPPAGDLTRAELRALVATIAARPEQWRHLVNHDPAARTYEQLRRDEQVAIWLICWMDDHDTGFHDHDVSCGALSVAQGAIIEERLALGGPPLRRRMRAGQAVDFAASDIHRVVHGGGGPAITINAYSPPLWRMAPTRRRRPASCSSTRSPTPRSCARSVSWRRFRCSLQACAGASSASTSAAPSRAIRDRGTTRSIPAASARVRVSTSVCR